MDVLKKLFSPVNIGTMELKNRIVFPPMVTNFCAEDGSPSDMLIAYLEERAKGGAGLIITEAVCIDPGGDGALRAAAMWSDDFVPAWRRLADTIHRHNARVMCQVYHAGRQMKRSPTGGQPVAPSPIPCPLMRELPRELTVEEIEELIEKFAQAARRCREAGIDGVEYHGAHGYLAAEFMSAYSNKRVDEYGGDLMGRLKFPLECIRRIRKEVGKDYPVTMRLSVEEGVPGGRTLQESKLVARIMAGAGLDAIHVSAGCYGAEHLIIPPIGTPSGIYVPYAEAMKEVVDVPVIVAGRINDPLLAEEILEEGKADLISMGRALIADPELPRKAAAGNFEDIIRCPGDTQGCIDPEGMRNPDTIFMRCSFNPFVGREYQWKITPAEKSKKVLVAGGGPGGLEAARIAAQRGHQVILIEKAEKLGGQLALAAVAPLFQEFATVVKNFSTQVKKLGVKVELGKKVTSEVIDMLKPEVVIIATGAVPLIPAIPGIKKPIVVTAHDILAGKVMAGNKVLILGGGPTGCDIADLLGEHGSQVTIIEMLEDIGFGVGSHVRILLIDRLTRHRVRQFTGAEVKAITDDGAVFTRGGVEETLGGMDTVVLALGAKPVDELYEKTKEKVCEVYVIGDARQPRNAFHAVLEGAEVALKL